MIGPEQGELLDGAADQNSGIRQQIDEIVRRIVERFHPEKIILFGSHARGNAGPDSDVDLLVVMEVDGNRRERTVDVRVAVSDVHVAKDIVIVTPQELERYRDLIGTLIRPALREGRILYERAG